MQIYRYAFLDSVGMYTVYNMHFIGKVYLNINIERERSRGGSLVNDYYKKNCCSFLISPAVKLSLGTYFEL
jgi:hypothetical protein